MGKMSPELRQLCARGAWIGVTLYLALFLLVTLYFQYQRAQYELGDEDAGSLSPVELSLFFLTGHTVLLIIGFGYCMGDGFSLLCGPFLFVVVLVAYEFVYGLIGAGVSWVYYRKKK